jgi:uncharacterized protein (DUF1330 family)
MPKGYWVTCYRSISDPVALQKYGELAGPALANAGGRFVVRGLAAKAYEAGLQQRCVILEFDSVQQAIATYESAEYKAALKVLGNAAERDLRIVEGV